MKHQLTHCLLLRLGLALPLVLPFFCSPGIDQPVSRMPVKRIISLSPSISRQIIDLGRDELLVGVTSFDDCHGRGIKIVGTLVQPNIEAIIMLKPDIVLFSSEDGPVQNIDRLREAGVGIYRFNRNRNFADISDNYLRLARMLGREQAARKKIECYTDMLNRARARRPSPGNGQRPLTVAFFLSHRPLIAASSGSFIAQVILDAGGVCIYSGTGGPYPLVSLESLVESDPDAIVSMAGDDDSRTFFERLSRDFGSLKVVANRTFYVIEPDTIPYYTPADYVKSVERISGILTKVPGSGAKYY